MQSLLKSYLIRNIFKMIHISNLHSLSTVQFHSLLIVIPSRLLNYIVPSNSVPSHSGFSKMITPNDQLSSLKAWLASSSAFWLQVSQGLVHSVSLMLH